MFRIEYRRDNGATVWTPLNEVYPPLLPHYTAAITDQNQEIGFEKYRIVEVPAVLQKWEQGEWQRVDDIRSHELESIQFWIDAQNAHAGFERLRLVEVES
jgi:hypothetical protein